MKTCIKLIPFTIYFIYILHAYANQYPTFQISDLLSLVDNIKSKCPPSKCIYIGIGRSPTPITTLMRLQPGLNVIDLPLSNFRYVAGIRSKIPGPSYALTTNQKDILFEHFKNYLPENIKGKTLMLIDYSVSGLSIASASEFIEMYYLKQMSKKAPNMSHFIITDDEVFQEIITANIKGRKTPDVHFGLVKNFPQLADTFGNSEFDIFSSEKSFDIQNFQRLEDYRSRWARDDNSNRHRELLKLFIKKIENSPELAKKYPISCASFYL